jgi:phospholipid/cholesterol/gamma-HCH transport system ATP-binding protein
VHDNVAYRLLEEHDDSEDIERRVREALSFVELEHTVDKLPSELSGGMRRRVAIARAIITEPEVILYDSPTGGLDPVTSTTIIELVVKQRDFYHTTSLLVTHRLADAFTMTTHRYDSEQHRMLPLPAGEVNDNTKFIMLRDGRVVFDGDIRDLASSHDEYIKEYIS